MKKRFFSIAVVLLLLFALQPPVYADMTYSAPEAVTIGSEFDHLVATVPADSDVSASDSTLPDGVEVGTEEMPGGAHMNVYLRGVPQSVGVYNCVISLGSEENAGLVIVPVTVVPETPVVTAGAGVNCFLNDYAQVSVTASVTSGSLTYQWYSNTANSIAGSTPIAGATQPVYQVNTSNLGTMYYYCTVTNTVDGQTKSVTSGLIPVTVGELTARSISMETYPTRRTYTAGDRLDPTGLSIRVDYTNGSSQVIYDTDAFGLYPTQLNTAGTQNVEVSYQGLTCIFQVTVEPAEEVITGIGVLTPPAKQKYTVGETLDTSGLSIRVYTNNGQRDVTTGFTCSPMTLERAGDQLITVSYEGFTCTFTLRDVQEEEKPTGIIVGSLPSKLNYMVGDTLDMTGLTLRLITNRNNAQDIYTGFTCSPSVLQTVGRQEITVSYEAFTCTFSVTVAAPPETSPPVQSTTQPFTPVPTVQPTVTPAPAATPHIIEHQSHSTGTSSALIVVIVIAAILGLGCLGAYVFIMNRGGMEGIFADLGALFARPKKPDAPAAKPMAPESKSAAPESRPVVPEEPPAALKAEPVAPEEPPVQVGKHLAPESKSETLPEEPDILKEKFFDWDEFK